MIGGIVLKAMKELKASGKALTAMELSQRVVKSCKPSEREEYCFDWHAWLDMLEGLATIGIVKHEGLKDGQSLWTFSN